jgi:hypothetical protein|tara:strand:- start:11771 stop:11974 length:204 start_codon:yes stop_codon:yes gene_type:complete
LILFFEQWGNRAIKMVKELNKDGKEYFQCEECSFFYEDRESAEKCEKWCKEKHSCNIEITKYAVKAD